MAELDLESLPTEYDLAGLSQLDQSRLKYMLNTRTLENFGTRESLLDLGPMGKGILLALGPNPNPAFTDYQELRRALYHFYYCDRGLPASLEDFKRIFGDDTQWPALPIHNRFPKTYPREPRKNVELGIYVAETIRNGFVYETEIILDGYREDGMLEFLAYTPEGELSSRGEFRAGTNVTVASAPYACMNGHMNRESNEFNVIFPTMQRPSE